MNPKEDFLIEECTGEPIYLDTLGTFQMVNGLLRFSGYRIAKGQYPGIGDTLIESVKFIMAIAGAEEAQLEMQRVLLGHPAANLHLWGGSKLSH